MGRCSVVDVSESRLSNAKKIHNRGYSQIQGREELFEPQWNRETAGDDEADN
jgi:hypothetical protein